MLLRPPETLDRDFRAIKTKMDQDYNNNISLWAIFWNNSNLAVRCEAGDESLMATGGTNVSSNGRGSWYFNRARPILNTFSGYQRRNRKSTVCVPLEGGDQKTADQYTKLLLHIYNKAGVYETISEAFHQGACITGMNMLHVYLDFRTDPVNGDIRIENIPYNAYMIDPYFREPDASDATFIRKRTWMTHSACASIMPPEYYEEIMSLPGTTSGTSADGRYQYMPESFGYTQANRIYYDEYYYRDYRKQKLLIDYSTGETMDITFDADKYDVNEFLKTNPTVRLEEKSIPTVRLAIEIQNKIFYDGPQPLNIDTMPFVPVVGFYNKSMPYMYQRIQGVCKSLIDPQLLYNRRIILSADYLESTVNTGFIFKENAVVDVKHLFQTGQGRIIPLKDEAQMSDIVQIQPTQVPPSVFQMGEIFDQEMYHCSGISPDVMGKVIEDDASGYKTALRQSAGMMAIEPLFDRLDNSQKLLGNLLLDTIQKNWTPGKIKKILEGEEPAPLFYNQAFGKYHCMIENGFNTESQRQLEFAQKLELRKAGIMIPDVDILKSATLQNKDEIIERMQQQQQMAMQQQQQQLQVQQQEIASRVESAHAKAMADMGLYNERTSRVNENYALAQERRAKSMRDQDEAILSLIKAAKELEGIDLQHLREILDMHASVKAQEKAELEQQVAQSEQQLAQQEQPQMPQQPQQPQIGA